MLPRRRRVHRSLFPAILRRGRVWQSPSLSLRVLPSSQVSPAKFSVIVSNKVCRRAVERNLWKRRTRAAIAGLSSQLKDNNYCLLYLKPDVKSLSYRQLAGELKDIFLRAGLLNLQT